MYQNSAKKSTFGKIFKMKKLVIPILILGFYFGFIEQNKVQPNIYILCISIVAIMFSMMQLMSKVPSKKPEDKDGII